MSPEIHTPVAFRTVLYYVFLSTVALLFIAYLLFQARFILAGPQIRFTSEIASVQQERVVYLEGQAENIVRLWLNGREIYTDQAGYFKEALVLENGYTIATLSAEDRYGRQKAVTRQFVFTPALARE